jgi:hypothetical protein
MPRFNKLTTLAAAAAVSLAGLALRTPGIGTSGAGTAGAATSGPRSVFSAALAQQSHPTPAPSSVTAAGITLRSVSVELPSSDRMFSGDKDAEAINNNCLACHSAGMVLTQPALTRTAWQQEVEKMRGQYKAPVDEADVPAIVAYLASHKGAP